MNRPLLRSLIIILVFSVFATGCWDRLELEERELAIAMAIDKVTNGLNVSIQVPITANVSGSGQSGGGESVQLYRQEARTLADALTKLNEKMDKTLFLGHLGLVLFSEEQSRDGIKHLLDLMRRNPYIQRRLYPVVTKGRSERLLYEGTEMEQIKAMFIRNLLETGENTEATIPFRLHHLLVSLSTPTREVPVLNYVGLEEGKFKWMGLAVFNKDRMIGTLSPDEAISLLQIREQRVGQKVLVQCPVGDGSFQFFPLNMRRKIRVTEEPRVQISIEVEGRLLEKTCHIRGKVNEQNQALEQAIQQYYEQKATQLVKKAQQEWELDIFELGHYLHAYHHALYDAVNWKKRFSQIPIDVSYQVYIRREGTSLN